MANKLSKELKNDLLTWETIGKRVDITTNQGRHLNAVVVQIFMLPELEKSIITFKQEDPVLAGNIKDFKFKW